MSRGPLLFAVALLGLWPTSALSLTPGHIDEVEQHRPPASETEEVDEILSGFDDDEAVPTEGAGYDPEKRRRIGGAIKLGSSINLAHRRPATGDTDWRGLSRLRCTLEIEIEQQLGRDWELILGGHAFHDLAFEIQGRDSFTAQVLDAYESELELDQSFLRGRLGRRVTVSSGRQVVVWGTSETLRVTDVLNPLDQREPGITDIEHLRLPLALSRVDVGAGRWTVTAIAVHEIRFDKAPAFGHDFYPPGVPPLAQRVPGDRFDNTELAAAVQGVFRGWDLSLYWADHYDHAPDFAPSQTGTPELVHSRVKTWGAAWDLARGDLLFKAEGAYHRGLGSAVGRDHSRLDLLAGIEYSGLNETSISLEAAERRTRGPGSDHRELEWALRASRYLFHQTLTLTLVAITFDGNGEGGALQRLEARYDLNDALELTTGVVLYHSGDRPGFEHIGANDRGFLDLVWRF